MPTKTTKIEPTANRSWRKPLLWVLGVVALVAILLSGGFFLREETRGKAKHRILVVHTYGGNEDYYEFGKGVFEQALKHNDMDAELRHIFMGMPHTYTERSRQLMVDEVRKLQAENWHPDVTILHGDLAIRSFLDQMLSMDSIPQVPVIYSNSFIPHQWETHPAYSRMKITGFSDSLYIHESLALFREIWGDNMDATFKIDRGVNNVYDDYVYNQLKSAIDGDPRYFDNLVCDITFAYRTEFIKADTLNPLIVNGISLRNPSGNGQGHLVGGDSTLWGRRVVRNVLRNAKQMRFIHFNQDLFSDIFTNRSEMPQLSLTSVHFEDKDHLLILGGYFADFQSKADDDMAYAKRLLAGEDIASLPPALHRPHIYLDWRAMEKVGLQYHDWSKKAIIKNAPFYVRQPNIYFLCFMGLFFLFIVAILYLMMHIMENQQKQREANKELLQTHLEWLMGGETVGLWYVLSGRRFIRVGASLARMLDITEEEYPIELFLHLVHPNEREAAERILSTEANDDVHQTHRLRIRKPYTQEYHWFQMAYVTSASALNSSDMIGMAELVDDDQRAQEQLMHSMHIVEQTRLKEAFLANMTHDIRNPLAVLTSFTNMLVTEYDNISEEERQMIALQVDDSTHTLLKLLGDVVDVSQMQLGEYRFIYRDVDVREQLTKSFTANRVIAPAHLEFHLAEGADATLYVDYDRMSQVVNNFLSNAFKNTPSGSVTLGWNVLEDEVEIYVEDTGIGIPDDQLPTIFDKYSKFDGQSGAGLGLNICKTIIEKQGGRIVVHSEVGKGSRFSAIMPLKKD